MEVDRHMVCDTGGERIAEYLARLNEGDIMFSDEVVLKTEWVLGFQKKV